MVQTVKKTAPRAFGRSLDSWSPSKCWQRPEARGSTVDLPSLRSCGQDQLSPVTGGMDIELVGNVPSVSSTCSLGSRCRALL